MNNAVTNAQLAKFEQLWQETCDLWPPPGFGYKLHASSKKDWNIIAVPHVDDWKSLIPVIEVIGEQWSWNKPYTLSQLHITLAGLGDTINWREKENELKSILDEITTDQDPIKIEFRGLNILRNTIIAQAIDVNGELTKLIAQLSKQIKKRNIVRNFRVGSHSEIWWTSIVRLYKPIPEELLSLISNFRDTLFGSFNINAIELCENNKTFESRETLYMRNMTT